jgi:hypothetical protein
MIIDFKNQLGLSPEQTAILQEKIVKPIPSVLLNFLKKNSGAIPMINGNLCNFQTIHSDGWKQDSFIENITTSENIISEFEDRDTLNLYFSSFELTSKFVEIEYLLPFAFAANGVLYCSIGGVHSGKVYFVDNGDFGILFQSESFERFWDSVF